MKENFQQFIKGLKKQSFIIILLGALLGGVLCFSLNSAIKNGVYLRLSLEQFQVSGTEDSASRVTYNVLKQNLERNDKYPVYVMGGSTTFFLYRGQVKFADYLSRDTDVDFEFINLTSTGQKMAETLCVVNNLPDGEGIIIIGLTARRFQSEMDLDRYLIDRTDTYAFLKENDIVQNASLNTKYNIVFNDTLQRVLDKIFFSDMLVPKQYRAAADDLLDKEDYQIDPDDYDLRLERIRNLMTTVNAEDIDNFSLILNEIAAVADAKGLTLLLVDLPISDELYGDITFEGQTLTKILEDVCTRAAETHPNTYFTEFAYGLDIQLDDYLEGYHVGNPEKLDLMRQGLAQIVAPLMSDAID